MEFGMFHEFQLSPGRTEAQTFAQAFEEIDAAERWGLDAVWLAELHFAPDRSALSAPIAVASAVAARTARLKIGTAVQVLPLCHPVRLAEEVATLDHISRGRLIFGVGRSSFPRSYKGYGVSYAESRERFAEILEILKLAWTRPSFSYRGAFYHFDDVSVVPTPYQKPYPPIRIAAASLDTYPTVGRLGHAILITQRLETLAELATSVQEYRQAYHATDHKGKAEVYLRIPVYVAETYQAARDEARDSMMHAFRYVGDRFQASATEAGARPIEHRTARAARLHAITYDEALRDKIVVGTPEIVADRLSALREELGLDGIVAEFNSGGLIAHERVMTSLRLLCDEVIPRFKQPRVDRPTGSAK
jgi:alkanesulfonate monooxygenase SsuD/methylene tetrahydromethanopterin reductase-like flavin-dependent oxidoreductase (luciferase family)